MVKIDEPTEKKEVPVTARLFLQSIKKWYNENGIHCCITSVSQPQKTDREDRVALAFNMDICEDMEECFAREIGEDGKVVMMTDEFGDEKPKITRVKNPEEVTIWLNINVENPENNEYKVYTIGSAFPLLNFAFIQSGDISADNKRNIIFTYDELLDAIEGLEFKAFTESRSFKGGKQYQVLIPEEL